jgi:hypothetical protein
LNKRGIKSIGIEPSKYLAKECINRNLNVYNSYLDETTVVQVTQSYGKASIVLGNNVFAHIEDMKSAFKNVFDILEDSGIFIFEVAHFKYIVTDGLFDTIYHEHMSYHTAIALESFATASGFKIFRIEEISSHGGSLRFYLSKNHDKLKEPSVELIKNDELMLGLNQVEALSLIEDKIKETKESVVRMIKDIGLGDDTVFVGYGAPAKVVTFLAQMELEEINLIGVIEDNVEKQNRFLPGSGFAIRPLEEMKKLISINESNELRINFLIFPWNLKKEIVEKLSKWVPRPSNAVVFFPTVEKVEF